MLSRINYYGRKVSISLRSTIPDSPVKISTHPEELATYTLHEGGFFGNLFTVTPLAYSCIGARDHNTAATPALAARRCTETSGKTMPDNQPLTHCNFISTGSCPNTGGISINGKLWNEIVHIYLDPDAGFAD